MNDLFSEQRIEYRLFDAQRVRFIPKVSCSMTEDERRIGDEYFARLKCAHLQWRVPVESGAVIREATETTSRVRNYKFSR